MKLREFESNLQHVRSFSDPKAELEQYATTPHLAAQLAHSMQNDFDDVEGKLICDLGCGAGMLSIAAAMAGALQVLSVDVDEDALVVARDNVHEFDVSDTVDMLRMDVCAMQTSIDCRFVKRFDTVLMNPPFGTKRRGVDIHFLHTALNMAKGAVYSMHKTSTRAFIQKRFADFGVQATVLAEMSFDIGRTYAFQKKQSKDIQVDLWRFDVEAADLIPCVIEVDRPLDKIGKHAERSYSVENRKMQGRRRGRRR